MDSMNCGILPSYQKKKDKNHAVHLYVDESREEYAE